MGKLMGLVMESPMKRTHKNHGLTQDILNHLYCELFLSDAEIGRRHGITDVAVKYYRNKWGIKKLETIDRIAGKAKLQGLRDIREVSKDEFEKIYEKCGERKMAKMFGCSKMLIRRFRKDYGIDALQKHKRHIVAYPLSFSREQKQVLIGSLLGDGGMQLDKARKKSARFYESHCQKQKDYLEWKRSVLLPFASRLSRWDKKLDDGRKAKGFQFRTCFHPVFLPLYEAFYGTGEKRLPEKVLEEISSLSLAVWYMDDGHLSMENKDGVFTLASGFPKEDIDKIAEILNRRFNLDIEPRDRGSVTVFWIHNKDRFFSLIGKHIRPEMTYKIPISQRFLLPHISLPNLRQKIENFDISSWSNLREEEKEQTLNDIAAYWHVLGFPFPKYNKKGRLEEIGKVASSRLKLGEDIPGGNVEGAGLCNSFFPNIWKARKNGKKSPIDVFWNRGLFKKVIRSRIEERGLLTGAALRSGLQSIGAVHNFRPAVAKAIYDEYCPKDGSVLDPCAGYGGRLLGFLCSEKPVRYVGVDACDETVKNLKHMDRILRRDIEGKDAEISYSAFEDWNTNEKFDLVFTSPPYFHNEVYGDDEKQSSSRYPTYYQWKDGFLRRLIHKSLSYLKCGGILVLNVANVKMGGSYYPVADDSLEFLNPKADIVACHNFVYPVRYGSGTKKEPIFVFKK
jgi:hypothetical protein